jgi:hypothetical protein
MNDSLFDWKRFLLYVLIFDLLLRNEIQGRTFLRRIESDEYEEWKINDEKREVLIID